jgi:hypothetical protein
VFDVVNDLEFLKLKYLIPPISNSAEIMPNSCAAKSAEIIDSCVLCEIVFRGRLVNKNKQ